MSEAQSLIYIEEPLLVVGFGQKIDYSKDGLFLFGPLADSKAPAELRVGVVGRPAGIERFHRWLIEINGYIPAYNDAAHHAAYPGFEPVFGCRWPTKPICSLKISDEEIWGNLYLSDRHEAIYRTVGLFEEQIRRYIREEDTHVDLWFVVIPEEIFHFGRPNPVNIPKDVKRESSFAIGIRKAKELQHQPSLFPEDNEAAEIYKYEVHFHNQLKARLLDNRAVVQVARETSLTPEDFEKDGRSLRKVQDPATIAWNLTTTSYFKASGRPWKLADVRDGVCYVGIVFKQDMTSLRAGNACCGAQMFLDSGDGLVFKGAVGPWYSKETKEYHLPEEKAYELINLVVNAYIKDNNERPPKELFIHGRTRFNEDEWNGFRKAAPTGTNIVGVRIRDDESLKLYTSGNETVPRGTAYLLSRRRGFLWTRGYIPRLQTYPGWEIPNPLSIEICRGEADLQQVMRDIMGLTKVNFNGVFMVMGFP